MLTPEIREFLDRSVRCWLATVDAGGHPNASPKEVFAQGGFKVHGRARIVERGSDVFAEFEEPLDAITQGAFAIRDVIVVEVERAEQVLAPSHRFVPGTTEESQIRSAMAAHGVGGGGPE